MSDSDNRKIELREKVRKNLPRKNKELNDTKNQLENAGGGAWWLSLPWWKKDL